MWKVIKLIFVWYSENMSLLYKWNCETFPFNFTVLKSLPLGSYHCQHKYNHLTPTNHNELVFPLCKKRVAVNFNNQYRTYPVTERGKKIAPPTSDLPRKWGAPDDSWQRNGDKQRRDNVKLRRIKFRLTSLLTPLPDAATHNFFLPHHRLRFFVVVRS